MPHRLLALMDRQILTWARMQAGLSVEDAASRANLDPDTLVAWEAGDSRPDFADLRRLAEIYSRPFGVFFLTEPPDQPANAIFAKRDRNSDGDPGEGAANPS